MDWFDFSWIHTPSAWAALAALSAMEIVLGIDNIVFISILSSKVPEEDRPKARRMGLALALITRLLLLASIKWIMGLGKVLASFDIPFLGVWEVTGKNLILLFGGLFLIGKATTELWEKLEGPHKDEVGGGARASLASVLVQIALLDVVFSLDSVITAVGMAKHLTVMALAMIAAVVVMLLFVNSISDFIEKHPSMKVLALSFLILIGVMLVAEGTGQHVSKGYIYFAMAFSLIVELLNVRFRKTTPVALHDKPS
ncbi:MAG: putative tellurium resistance membrane protein TerC [Planctomycetota bacterium]|jgi:predicted tellurium resistance membrane protein TerC